MVTAPVTDDSDDPVETSTDPLALAVALVARVAERSPVTERDAEGPLALTPDFRMTEPAARELLPAEISMEPLVLYSVMAEPAWRLIDPAEPASLLPVTIATSPVDFCEGRVTILTAPELEEALAPPASSSAPPVPSAARPPSTLTEPPSLTL
jgi:hypothetical protein